MSQRCIQKTRFSNNQYCAPKPVPEPDLWASKIAKTSAENSAASPVKATYTRVSSQPRLSSVRF